MTRSILSLLFSVLLMQLASTSTFGEELSGLIEKGRELNRSGNYREAIEVVEEGLNRKSIQYDDVVSLLSTKGSAQLRSGEYEESIASFTSLLQMDRANFWALWQRCWAATQIGKLGLAQLDCRNARRILNRKTRFYKEESNLADEYSMTSTEAELLRAMGRPNSAIKLLEKYLEGEGGELWSNQLNEQIGRLYYATGKTDKAIESYRRALRSVDTRLTTTQQAELFWLTGNALLSKGQGNEALEEYRKSLLYHGGDERFIYSACTASLMSENSVHALEYCGLLSEEYPNNTKYMDAFGRSLIIAKKYNRAREVFNDILEYEPDNLYAISAIEQIASREKEKN